MGDPKTIREQLTPHIRRIGVVKVADACDVPGVTPAMLSSWLNQRKRTDGRARQPNAAQIDAIAKAVGVTIEVSTTNEN